MVIIEYQMVWVPIVRDSRGTVVGIFDGSLDAQLFIDADPRSHVDGWHIEHLPHYSDLVKVPSGEDKNPPGWD